MGNHKKESLPSWYKRDDYAECKSYDYRRWWIELIRRQSLYNDIISLSEDEYIPPPSLSDPCAIIDPERYYVIDKKEFDSILKMEWSRKTSKPFPENIRNRSELIDFDATNPSTKNLIKDGVIILTVRHRFNELVGIEASAKKKGESKYFSYKGNQRLPCGEKNSATEKYSCGTVRLTTWRDTLPIYEEWNRNPDIKKSVYHSYRGLTFGADDPILCDIAQSAIDIDLGSTDTVSVQLNLSANNKKIIEDLQKFLELYKKDHSHEFSPAVFEISELKKLYENNVLAIIDLHLYELLEDINLSKKCGVVNIADSIRFSELQRKDGNWYTRTARPYALKLLKEDTLSVMFHRAFS